MAQRTPLYIVASPSPQVGKTLIARLAIEFLLESNREPVGYDLDTREPEFARRFPNLVASVDISDTRGQMALFDRLIAAADRPTVIDLGYGAFDTFFAVMAEIGFVREAQRRGIDPVVLYVSDSSPATLRAYAKLQHELRAVTFVPVHNESVFVMFDIADFPPSRPELGIIRIPRLSAIVRGVVDRPSFSFGVYMNSGRPGGPTEVHSWIENIFAEFRELELRQLMGKLSDSLGAPAFRRPPDTRPAR
jgi:hypothetical protein